MQGVVQHTGQLCGADPTRCHEIGTANVADKQRITCQHSIRPVRVLRQVVDQNGDGLWRVARGFAHCEADLPERQRLAVPAGGKGVVGLRPGSQAELIG